MSADAPVGLTRDARALVPTELLRALFAQYRMSWMGLHGIGHWARVLDNGLTLADAAGADREVVALFAVFHDACRRNDHLDPHHGPRAAKLVEELAHLLPRLDAARAGLLMEACHGHTDGGVSADPTIGACWDADRLDLARVGIRPNARYLSTDAARNPSVIEAATRRAVADHVHEIVTDVWLPLAQRAPERS